MIDNNDYQQALNIFHQRYVDSPNDPNAREKFAECVRLLGTAHTPDQISEAFERYFADPNEFMKNEVNKFLQERGTDATFGDLKEWQAAQNSYKGGHAE